MVADTEGARRWNSWARRIAAQPGWAGLLANAALILRWRRSAPPCCIFTHVISGANVAAAAIMIVAFAAIFGAAAGGARWMHAALVGAGRHVEPGARRLARSAADPGAGRPDRLRQHRLSRSFSAIAASRP